MYPQTLTPQKVGQPGGYFSFDQQFPINNQPSVPLPNFVNTHSNAKQSQTMNNKIKDNFYEEQERQRRIHLREQERERRRLGLSQPNNYGGVQKLQEITTQNQQYTGNQGSPINMIGKGYEMLPNSNNISFIQPFNEQIVAPMLMQEAQYMQPIDLNQQFLQQQYPLQNQIVRTPLIQDINYLNIPQQSIVTPYNQNPLLPSQQNYIPIMNQQQFMDIPYNEIQQQQQQVLSAQEIQAQQMLNDYYRRNVNSTMFNQRSRSHQHLDSTQKEVKLQYAKILEFQRKEQEALKARNKSQERSFSPQQFTFFEKFGQPDPRSMEHASQEKQKHLRDQLKNQIEEKERKREQELREKERYDMQIMRVIQNINKNPAMTVAENLRMAESIPLPSSEPKYNALDHYKSELLVQIEENKRKKDNDKQKKLEEEMKDELRVKRELEELNLKYKIEMGIIKPNKPQQQEIQKQTTSEEYGEEQEEEEEEEYYEEQEEEQEQQQYQTQQKDNGLPYFIHARKEQMNNKPQQKRKVTKPKANINQQQKTSRKKYQNDMEPYQKNVVINTMDPMKKQLQAQLVHFQKDIQKLQKQQKDMIKNYQKEVEKIQSQKKAVINDIQNDQGKEMKKQIENLQNALNQLQSKSQAVERDLQALPQTQQTVSNKQDNLSSNVQPFENSQTDEKTKVVINFTNKIPYEDEKEIITSEDDIKFQGIELKNKYNNEKQMIITPMTSQKQKLKTPTTKFKKQLSNGNLRSQKSLGQIAKMMQGQEEEIKEESGSYKSLNPDERPIKPMGTNESFTSSINNKKTSRSKMKALNNLSNSKLTGKKTPVNKRNSKLPPKHTTSQTSNHKLMTEENEVMSISNMLKTVKSDDINDRDNDNYEEIKMQLPHQDGRNTVQNNMSQTNSILRKNSQGRMPSFKSVRILDNSMPSQFQGLPSQDNTPNRNNDVFTPIDFTTSNSPDRFIPPKSEFFMGQQNLTLEDEMLGTDYVQQSRDLEKQYYEDVIRPNKVKENIESHNPDLIANDQQPEQIGGIKIIHDESENHNHMLPPPGMTYNPAQEDDVLQPFLINSRRTEQFVKEQEELGSKLNNFLFNKNLIVDMEQDNLGKANFQNYQQELESPNLSALQERLQYTLRQMAPNNEEQEDFNQEPDMKQQLSEIQQIIVENSKLSEEVSMKFHEKEKQGLIEFNKSFQKNLKAVEDIFENDSKRKTQKSSFINLNQIEKTENDNNFYQNESTKSQGIPKFLKRPIIVAENVDSLNSFDLQQNQQLNDLNEQPKDILPIINNEINLFDLQNSQQQDIDLTNNNYQNQQQQQHHFHLLSFLLNNKNDPNSKSGTPTRIKNLQSSNQKNQNQQKQQSNPSARSINQHQKSNSHTSGQVQYTHLNQDQHSPRHFNSELKKQLIPQEYIQSQRQKSQSTQNILQALQRPSQNLTQVKVSPKNVMIQNYNSKTPSIQPVQQNALKQNIKPPQQVILDQTPIKHSPNQEDDYPNVQQSVLNLNNIFRQQQYQNYEQRNHQPNQHLPYHQRINSAKDSSLSSAAKKPPLPQIYQQKQRLQQAITDIIQQHNEMMEIESSKPQEQNQQDSMYNVFTDNSRINEVKIPFKIYNPYFKEEIPANKVYSKNDPFLINLNLREKLTETNQMIYVDNQNLIEKIQKLEKSIKPVTYGFPYIDLTKADTSYNENKDEMMLRQQTQSAHLKLKMNDFMKSKRPIETIDITNENKTSSGDAKYMNFNFNGESVQDIKEKMKNQFKIEETPEQKKLKLLKKAKSYHNSLVQSIIESKIQSDGNLGQIPAIQKQYALPSQNDPQKQFLEYLQDQNVNNEQQNNTDNYEETKIALIYENTQDINKKQTYMKNMPTSYQQINTYMNQNTGYDIIDEEQYCPTVQNDSNEKISNFQALQQWANNERDQVMNNIVNQDSYENEFYSSTFSPNNQNYKKTSNETQNYVNQSK